MLGFKKIFVYLLLMNYWPKYSLYKRALECNMQHMLKTVKVISLDKRSLNEDSFESKHLLLETTSPILFSLFHCLNCQKWAEMLVKVFMTLDIQCSTRLSNA